MSTERYWAIFEERELDDVEQRDPADHYVVVDDKLRILTAVKQAWGDRVTLLLEPPEPSARRPAPARSGSSRRTKI